MRAIRSRPNRNRAFSLTEVLLAVGLVGSVSLAIVSFFVLGSNAISHSIQKSIGTQIVQTVVGEIQSRDWELDRLTYQPAIREILKTDLWYFDDQGTWLRNSNLEATFTAWVEIAAAGIALPGALPHLGTENPSANPFSQQIIVHITPQKISDVDYFTDAKNQREIDRFSVVVTSRRALR